MGAIKDLLNSERGIVALALIISVTVLCALGSISTQQWLDYSKWIFVTYAAAKTVTGAIVAAKATPVPSPAAVASVVDAAEGDKTVLARAIGLIPT
jgi:hypothetical protein